jgi:uncharacterized protein (UPF0332 family)
MDTKEFLGSAQELIQGNREIDYRNAASRAYYSAFHCCKSLVEKLPNTHGSIGSSHQKVVADLLSYPDNRIKKLGRKLEQAKTLRHQADYKLHIPFTRNNAKQVILHVKQILLEIDEILNDN